MASPIRPRRFERKGDIEAAFTDERGVCLLSRTGVSEVTEALWGGIRGLSKMGSGGYSGF